MPLIDHTSHQDPPTIDATRPSGVRSRRTLRFDGRFLVVAGVGQLASELLSHARSAGLHGDTFADSPYTIGFVEAHGLAAMFGAVLIWASTQVARRPFHCLAIAIHVFLAAANVIFWDSFVTFDFVAAGVLATVAHTAFIAANVRCITVRRATSRRRCADQQTTPTLIEEGGRGRAR